MEKGRNQARIAEQPQQADDQVAEGRRWAILGKEASNPQLLIVSSVAVLVTLLGGLFYFRRMERSFAEVV